MFNVNHMVSVFLGGTVHMVCRNKERAEAAREEIVERSKNQVVCCLLSHQNNSMKTWTCIACIGKHVHYV